MRSAFANKFALFDVPSENETSIAFKLSDGTKVDFTFYSRSTVKVINMPDIIVYFIIYYCRNCTSFPL